MVKACALGLAEIERQDRLKMRTAALNAYTPQESTVPAKAVPSLVKALRQAEEALKHYFPDHNPPRHQLMMDNIANALEQAAQQEAPAHD